MPFKLDEALTASLTVLGLSAAMIVGTEIGSRLSPPGEDEEEFDDDDDDDDEHYLRRMILLMIIFQASGGTIFVGLFLDSNLWMWGVVPAIISAYYSGGRGFAAWIVLFGTIVVTHWPDSSGASLAWLVNLIPMAVAMILLSSYDGPGLRRRAYQTLIILALLFALNEISLLGLNLYAPKV